MSIINAIALEGYYHYSPEEWSEQNDLEINELTDLGLINTLDKELGSTEYNNCYYYVAKGNPLNLRWVIGQRGRLSLEDRSGNAIL